MEYTHKVTGQKLKVTKEDKVYETIASSPSWKSEQPLPKVPDKK